MTFKDKVSRKLAETIRGGRILLDIEMSIAANRDLNEAFFVFQKDNSTKYLKQLSGAPVTVNGKLRGKIVKVRFRNPAVGGHLVGDLAIQEDPQNELVK